VSQHSVEFDPDGGTDLSLDFPGIVLPASLAQAVRKRQAEFLAGRHCAREAIRVIAPEYARSPIIGIGRNREPIWPPGIVGTITHTSRYASVAVARSSDAAGLGLDVERLIAADVAARLRDHIAAPEELAALALATGWSMPLLLTVVFSAKETLFKCLYPQVGHYFDFRDAAVTAIDDTLCRMSVCLLVTLTAELPAGHQLHGRFERNEATVSTAMVLPP
jgi:enterobactin synthetase component D